MEKRFENEKLDNFQFTSTSTSKLTEKLSKFMNLKNMLENSLNFKNYTNKITAIFYIYQAFAPDDIYSRYKEKKVIRRKTKVFEIYMNLDYYRFLEVDNEEAKSMMSELYLKGIEKFLIGRKDFKGKEFYKDVKQLFEKHELISKKPETATNE